MNRIDTVFGSLQKGESALIGYATAGFPDKETSLRIAQALLQHCDLLELGIPFSDPVMDGPVIQESSRRSLEAGARIKDVMDIVSELRAETDKPLLVMTYYNPVHRTGHRAFAKAAALAGVDGVLIPDLPPEEMEHWRTAAEAEGLSTILFASMTTPEERLRQLGQLTQGFLYCIAVKGTTGVRDSMSGELDKFMSKARSCSEAPLALGLGISNPEQCRRAGELADAVIVGSALVKMAMEALDKGEDPAQRSVELARQLKDALRNGD
jgi:tryptophan synthase alpha chain